MAFASSSFSNQVRGLSDRGHYTAPGVSDRRREAASALNTRGVTAYHSVWAGWPLLLGLLGVLGTFLAVPAGAHGQTWIPAHSGPHIWNEDTNWSARPFPTASVARFNGIIPLTQVGSGTGIVSDASSLAGTTMFSHGTLSVNLTDISRLKVGIGADSGVGTLVITNAIAYHVGTGSTWWRDMGELQQGKADVVAYPANSSSSIRVLSDASNLPADLQSLASPSLQLGTPYTSSADALGNFELDRRDLPLKLSQYFVAPNVQPQIDSLAVADTESELTYTPEPAHVLLICAAAIGAAVWLRRRLGRSGASTSATDFVPGGGA